MNALLLLLWLAGLVQILIAASNFFLPRKLSQEQPSRPAPGCPQRRHSESDVPSLSEKTVPATRQDRKHFSRRSNASSPRAHPGAA